MLMGEGLMIHMNHLLLVTQIFPRLRHGLTKNHIERKDCQNWRSAQELTYLCVQDCLKEIIEGRNGQKQDRSLLGTLTYLEVVWHYVEIFFSPVASLADRIQYAGFVTHFLAIWKNFVNLHPEQTLQKNFLTRECYQDCLISCHFAVLLICYMRDNFPDLECRLDLIPAKVFSH